MRILLLPIILLLFSSCQNDVKTEKGTTIPAGPDTRNLKLNISLLLDLSDRIDTLKYPNPSMQYYKRDVGYIETISSTFLNHLRRKKVRTIDDRIALFFEPEPGDQQINTISNNLKFHLTRNNVTIPFLDSINYIYANQPQHIYELALADKKFVGSDTWSFFKNKVKDYTIEEGYKNILVIFTDGYMFHVDNKRKEGNLTTYVTPEDIRNLKLNGGDWEKRMTDNKIGFLPATNDLEDLNVLVLGINPDSKNVYEEDVIKKYWSIWFEEMGVNYYEIRNAELPSNMEKIIQDFIARV